MRWLLTLAAVTGVIHGAAAQSAADKVSPALKDLLAPRAGNKICFTRVYDAAHLQQHPKQKVRELALQVSVEHIKEDNLFRYNFGLSAKMKGQAKTLQTSGECSPAAGRRIFCGVECDGGGVNIEQAGPENLMVYLAEDGKPGRIRMAPCGESDEENAVELTSGADDKVFRLSKAPASACRAMGSKR
jgi:hypothetical protein